MSSERFYYAWPPTALFGWLLLRKRVRPHAKLMILLGVMLAVLSIIVAFDFTSGAEAFQTGEMSRAAYCLLGFGLVMAVLKRSLFRLLQQVLPSGAMGKIRFRLPINVLWILFFAAVSYPYLLSYMQIHPLKGRDHSDPQQYSQLAFENVAWRSRDGTILRGWLVPAEDSDRTAIACHGVMDTRSGTLYFIEVLHQAGYNVLAFDLRGHGQSERWTVTYGAREKDDIIAAVDYLKASHPAASRRVVGVGVSMGAACMILAAAEDQRIEAVHADAPYASTADMAHHIGTKIPRPLAWWSYWVGTAIGSLEASSNLFTFNTTDSVARISPRPIMIVHGTADEVIPIEQGRRVFTAAREPKSFHTIEGAGHCQTIDREPTRYAERMAAFLNDALIQK